MVLRTFSFIFGLLLATSTFGQIEVSFSTVSVDQGGTVEVDVTVNGFEAIAGCQFSVNWDPNVFHYNDITFTNSGLDDFSVGNFSGPGGTGIDEGQLTMSFNDPQGDAQLADGSVLFSFSLDAVGAECDESTVVLSDDPTRIEAFDINFDDIPVNQIQEGLASINGTDCGGGGGNDDDLIVTAAQVFAANGTNVCVPITVENFEGVQGGSGITNWDPDVISYTGFQNAALSGFSGSVNDLMADDGVFIFVWFNNNINNPVSLPDNSVLFELCFDVVGQNGDMSPITLVEEGNNGWTFNDDNEQDIPQQLNDGKVTVQDDPSSLFTLSVATVDADENTNVCVNVTTNNFDDISGLQYAMTWDDQVLEFTGTDCFGNLPGVNNSSFNLLNGNLNFSWNNSGGLSLDDGSVLYCICFDVIGECDESSAVQIESAGTTQIEILDGNVNEIENFVINQGGVTVECEADCFTASKRPACAGELNGRISVNVPTDTGCSCSWVNDAAPGTEVSTDCNLVGFGAGSYTLTVTCDGEEVCTITDTIDELPAVGITGEVTNASCGNLGSITLTITNGGASTSYAWNDGEVTKDRTNLEAGDYTVTVTDTGSSCSATQTFTVTNDVMPLTATGTIVNTSCNGDVDGAITLNPTGGCAPYEFVWSTGATTKDISGVGAATYTVTITDDLDTEFSTSFEVSQPAVIMVDGTILITPSSGANGSISITLTGGTEDYTYTWSGPTTGLPNSSTITGLMPGTYSLMVNDANGCTFTQTGIIVPETGDTADIGDDTGAVGDFNGFNIACGGDAAGVISGSILGGVPGTLVLSGDDDRTINITTLGTFTIEGLPAGTYDLTYTDGGGNSDMVSNIVITEPDPFVIDFDSGCDNSSSCDGFIDLLIEGGIEDYTVTWSDPDLSGISLDDLCEGTYVATALDANNCEVIETINIRPCTLGGRCYEAPEIITPNQDGMNDRLTFTCLTDFPANLQIFDRYSKLIFEDFDYDGRWEGTDLDGTDVPEGGYIYVLDIDFGQGNRETVKGVVTVLRNN